MGIIALVHINFDLLSVGVAVAGIALLGFIIYFNNPTGAINRAFFLFALWNVVWSISNYFEYRFTTVGATLWALRLHLFFSVWYALLFFRLAYTFSHNEATFPRWYRFGIVPLVLLTAVLTLTPLVFSGIPALAPPGYVTNPSRGPGILLFVIVAFGLLLLGLVVLLRKMLVSVGLERRQTLFVLIGMTATAFLILIFNVVLPVIFNNLGFIPLAALFLLPFIALTFYAIYRHHLFDLKVATTALLGFLVTIFSFVNILYSSKPSEVIINITAFLIVLIGSIKIVKDTLALEDLADALAETNRRQEGLLHFISHEVKGFLTKDQGAFSALLDGDFGELPEGLRPFVERSLAQARDGVISVTDILKASNQKKGTTEYKKEQFDLKELAAEVAEKARAAAEAKGLIFSFTTDGEGFQMEGDKAEVGDHVLRNLIDNAVNYTPSGSVDVSLRKEGGTLIFAVKDTGVGITDEDKARLFTEGGHGKDSQKVNVHSTGYGLFIAKNIITAHGGTIRAESEGVGRGATFEVRFPVPAVV